MLELLRQTGGMCVDYEQQKFICAEFTGSSGTRQADEAEGRRLKKKDGG